MKINGKEYITVDQLVLLKQLYLDDSEDPEIIYPTKQQVAELMQQQEHMDINRFLADTSGFWWIALDFDPQTEKKGDYEKLMNPSPSFLNEYGEPLYKNPFCYQHMLDKGNHRTY